LDLTLFIHTEHHSVLGRIHVQAYHVAYLLDEQWIGRELKGFGAMRLHPEGTPDAADGHPTEACDFGQFARTPVRLPARCGLERLNDDLLDLLVGDLAWRSRPRFTIQSLQARLEKPRPPLAHHA
jgi:hypothetical protein